MAVVTSNAHRQPARHQVLRRKELPEHRILVVPVGPAIRRLRKHLIIVQLDVRAHQLRDDGGGGGLGRHGLSLYLQRRRL